MSKARLNAILLLLALAGIALLQWRQRETTASHELHSSAKSAPRPDGPASKSAAIVTPAGLDAKARAMLATIDRLLSAANARAREALLTFKDDAAYRRFLERAATSGLTVLGRVDGLRTARVQYDHAASLRNELLQNAEDYTGMGANYLVSIPRAPGREDRVALNQTPFGNDTLAFLGATGDRSNWGRGTLIAILDSGVTADATFGAGRVQTLDVGFGLTPGQGSDDGHGTAVAALAAGASADAPGVAPAASILSIRVTDANGLSDLFTISQAIVAAVDAGARVVNISLGGYGTNAALDAAIAYAGERGAVIVAAAGNDQAAQLTWPAADPRVISVGAVDKAEQQVLFSNSSPLLSISAPGYGVQTAWLDGQRVYVDGTSASSPLVAGAIAAVLSQDPTLSATQAAQVLTRNATDAGAPGADPAFGAGILNLGWAMNSGTPGYVDTAVASHYFDAESNQMQFVVQNRSSQIVAGMNLTVQAGAATTSYAIPTLAAGESYVVKTLVNDAALKAAGSLRFSTQLTNPTGLVDQRPANNRRASVLSGPGGQ